MSRIRARIETGFETLGRSLYRHPLITLILMAVFIAATISQIPKITVDTSTEGFLHENDPALKAYNAFRDQFGRDEMAIVAVETDDIFDPDFLKKLRRLHVELRDNVPYIDDITSLINARNTRGRGDELIVEDLLEDWPETPADFADVRRRALDNVMYRNMLLSEDATFTTIIIQTQTYTSEGESLDVLSGFDDMAVDTGPEERAYLTDEENSEMVRAVQEVIRSFESPGFEIHLAGSPVVTDYLKRTMMRDMRKFLVLAVGTIAVFLFFMFRRVSGVVLPLLIVVFSLLSTVGLMAAFGVSIKLPTQILPSFLLAVSVGDAVHILAIFFQQLRKNGNDKEAAVAYAVGHSGLAVLMTSITTAAGLLSFSTAEIAPIADLGIFSAAGVMLALVYTIVLLPPLLRLMPIRAAKPAENGGGGPLDRLLSAVGRFSTGRPWPILLVSGAVLLVSILGMTRIRFSHDIVKWYPEDADVRVATETIDREMRGSIALEIVLDTGKVNGLYDPDLLHRLDASAAYVEGLHIGEVFAGKAWTITTILKEIHQALNENRPEFYAVPDDRRLIAQEFLLFENSGSDDLEDVTDSQFSKARFTIKVPFTDAVAYSRFIDTVNDHFQRTYPDAEVTTTGMTALLFRTITNVITTMARSYATALVVVTVLMVLLIGKPRIGVLSMIPNLFPILLTLGIMGWFHISMDLFTMLVGSIAIGLAVDDTVHFMHNFRRYFEETGDARGAVLETLHTAGRAMLVTTCVLSVGFFIFMFADMNNLFNFGMLTGFTIIMALAADYFIAPALMVVVNRNRSAAV